MKELWLFVEISEVYQLPSCSLNITRLHCFKHCMEDMLLYLWHKYFLYYNHTSEDAVVLKGESKNMLHKVSKAGIFK